MLSTAGPSAVPLLVELGIALAIGLTLLLRGPPGGCSPPRAITYLPRVALRDQHEALELGHEHTVLVENARMDLHRPAIRLGT